MVVLWSQKIDTSFEVITWSSRFFLDNELLGNEGTRLEQGDGLITMSMMKNVTKNKTRSFKEQQ